MCGFIAENYSTVPKDKSSERKEKRNVGVEPFKDKERKRKDGNGDANCCECKICFC